MIKPKASKIDVFVVATDSAAAARHLRIDEGSIFATLQQVFATGTATEREREARREREIK